VEELKEACTAQSASRQCLTCLLCCSDLLRQPLALDALRPVAEVGRGQNCPHDPQLVTPPPCLVTKDLLAIQINSELFRAIRSNPRL
jgi:hypothetical protein